MRWLGPLSALALGAGVHCTANAAGADPWGAEIAKPSGEPKSDSRPARRTTKSQDRYGELVLSGDRTATMARLEVMGDVAVQVFTLPNPYRVIVELSGTTVKPPGRAGSEGHGLVERYHSGRFEAGKSRIVMETLGPVKATPFPIAPGKDGSKVLEVALTPLPVQEFGKGTGARPAAQRADAPGAAAAELAAGLPAVDRPPARPVIVIDPGHGGIDPGAVGAANLLEKTIVMAVAEKLHQKLSAHDRYQVHLTRTADVFLSLDQRVGISRKHAANLFISLHADSIESTSNSQNISGATVYTLSERASDEQARIMAEKENASDLLGGLSADREEADDVKDILIDLIKRETASFSAEFASALRGNLGKSIQLSRAPMRSAAFKVLKQPHAPSVLIELGYMSNANDAQRLNSPEWQNKVAAAIAAAVDAYFASRTARAK